MANITNAVQAGLSSKTVFWRPSGSDALDGTSVATAVQTIEQAIVLAAALTPASGNKVTISCDESARVMTNGVTLPDFVNLFAPGIELEGNTATAPMTLGQNNVVVLERLENTNASGVCLDYDGSVTSFAHVQTISATGANGIGVKHRNNAASNTLDCQSINANGICVQNTSANSAGNFYVDGDQFLAVVAGGIVFQQNGACPMSVDANLAFGAAKDIDLLSGQFLGNISALQGTSEAMDVASGAQLAGEFTAITGAIDVTGTATIQTGDLAGHTTVQSGGDVYLTASQNSGNITCNSGGTLHVWVVGSSGTVTPTGPVHGYVDGTYYGDAYPNPASVEKATVDSPVTVSGNTQVLVCDATAGAMVVNLPAISGNQTVDVKKIDTTSNTVTINANGTEKIDGTASGTVTLTGTLQPSVTLYAVSPSTGWIIK